MVVPSAASAMVMSDEYDTTIVQLPLAFVRSGLVDTNLGHSRDRGSHGFGWSRVSQSTTATYLLYTGSTGATPSYYDYCWRGFPLRYSTIVQLPLAFVRSGYMDVWNYHCVSNIGEISFDWSRTAKTSTWAYRLNSGTMIYPLDYANFFDGFPIRRSAASPYSTYP